MERVGWERPFGVAEVLEGNGRFASLLPGKAGANVVGKGAWARAAVLPFAARAGQERFWELRAGQSGKSGCAVPGSWKGNGRFPLKCSATASAFVGKVSQLRRRF
jgi:hypothetical protein